MSPTCRRHFGDGLATGRRRVGDTIPTLPSGWGCSIATLWTLIFEFEGAGEEANGMFVGVGFKTHRFEGVLSNGFKDLEFEALRWTTNRAGMRFPMEAQEQRFFGNAEGGLDVLAHFRVQVTSVEYPEDPFALDFAKFGKVIATDSRLADAAERPPSQYSVTNDVWVSINYLDASGRPH